VAFAGERSWRVNAICLGVGASFLPRQTATRVDPTNLAFVDVLRADAILLGPSILASAVVALGEIVRKAILVDALFVDVWAEVGGGRCALVDVLARDLTV
jgi:hypothetical protein